MKYFSEAEKFQLGSLMLMVVCISREGKRLVGFRVLVGNDEATLLAENCFRLNLDSKTFDVHDFCHLVNCYCVLKERTS